MGRLVTKYHVTFFVQKWFWKKTLVSELHLLWDHVIALSNWIKDKRWLAPESRAANILAVADDKCDSFVFTLSSN